MLTVHFGLDGINMERKVFENGYYLLTFYYPYDNEFDCYSCENMEQVFQIITDKVKDELQYVRDMDSDFLEELSERDEAISLIHFIDSKECITNPTILESCFNLLLPDYCYGYRVVDGHGNVQFSFRCK